MTSVTVRVLRSLLLRGDVLSPGEHCLTPEDAADVIDSRRAVLVYGHDAQAVEDARRRAVERVLRDLRARPAEPWQPLGAIR